MVKLEITINEVGEISKRMAIENPIKIEKKLIAITLHKKEKKDLAIVEKKIGTIKKEIVKKGPIKRLLIIIMHSDKT